MICKLFLSGKAYTPEFQTYIRITRDIVLSMSHIVQGVCSIRPVHERRLDRKNYFI